MKKICPCGSTKEYDQCCGRFLDAGELAKTPEQLMRSRFSAYALGGYGQYLLATWFPATARGLTVPELSRKSVDWQRLEVLAKSQSGEDGMVEFKAYFKDGKGNDALETMHEISEFKRINGRWLYVGGRVS